MQNPPPYQSYGTPPPDGAKGPLGLEPNMFATICYLPCCIIPVAAAIIGIVMEKNNRFIRFHAFQSLFLYIVLTVIFIALYVVSFVLGMIGGTIAVLGALIIFVIEIVLLVVILAVSIWLMVKAYGGAMTKLPMIGDLAEKQAG